MIDSFREKIKDNVSENLFTISDTFRAFGVEQINAAVSQANHGDILDAKFNLKLGHTIKRISNKIETIAFDIMMDND